MTAAPFDGMAQAGLALFVTIARKSLGADDFQIMLFTMAAPLCFFLILLHLPFTIVSWLQIKMVLFETSMSLNMSKAKFGPIFGGIIVLRELTRKVEK